MAGHAHNLRAQSGRDRPFGVITRGTTGVNRLRRSDLINPARLRVRQFRHR